MHFFVRYFETHAIFVYIWRTRQTIAALRFFMFLLVFSVFRYKVCSIKNFLFPAPPKAFIRFIIFFVIFAPARKRRQRQPSKPRNEFYYIRQLRRLPRRSCRHSRLRWATSSIIFVNFGEQPPAPLCKGSCQPC